MESVLPAHLQMAFRAHPPRSINLSTLIRCRHSSRPSKAETPGGLLPPGADEVKQPKTSVIVESTGLAAPKKIATVSSSKDVDSQAREQRQPALAYPPEYYFDTHQTVMKLRALGQL